MNKIFIYTMIIVLGGLMIRCSEEKHGPIEVDAAPTGPVSNVRVEPTWGGGRVTYTLPTSKSLSHVVAEVHMPDGKTKQFVSSQYTTTIEIEGLPKIDTYKVDVYAVNKSNHKSVAEKVEFACLQPPYLKVYESLKLSPDFGGINVKWDGNDSEARLGMVIMHNDSLGDFVQYASEYSTLEKLSHSFRGMKSEENKFGVFIKDRFGNTSDTLYAQMKPLFEKLVPKSKFKEVLLPGDTPIWPGLSYVQWQFLWDDVVLVDYDNPYSSSYYSRYFVTSNAAALPQHITIDIGDKYILSRMRLNNYYRFSDRNPKKYEVWGHPGPPPADGSWNGWVKLGEHEQFKPSGNLAGVSPVTAEDKKYWLDGDMVSLRNDVGRIRYIRLKVLSNWAGSANFAFHEITFWGSN